MEFCLRGKTAKTNIYDGFLIFCYFSSVPLFHSYSSKAFHIVFKLLSLCLPRGWRWGAGGGGVDWRVDLAENFERESENYF